MTAVLADLGERFAIPAIVPTSYGSAAALVGNAELVLPILDNEADPPVESPRPMPRIGRASEGHYPEMSALALIGCTLRNDVAEVRKAGAHRNSGAANEDDEVIGLAIRGWRFEAVEGDRVVAEQVSYFGRGAAGGEVVEDRDPGGVAVGLLRDRPVAGIHEPLEAEAFGDVVEVGAELSACPAVGIGLGDHA
jgi:hypothetical protein